MMILIAMDPKGNRRVLVREQPGNGINKAPDGYLSADESRQWLTNNGYEVTDTASGIQLKKESPGHSINAKLGDNVIGYPLPEGRTLFVFYW